MPYDLYGTYYASARDAENAEMAQCAAIDADIAYREIEKLKHEMHRQQQEPTQLEYEVGFLQQKVQALEERLKSIEEKLNQS